MGETHGTGERFFSTPRGVEPGVGRGGVRPLRGRVAFGPPTVGLRPTAIHVEALRASSWVIAGKVQKLICARVLRRLGISSCLNPRPRYRGVGIQLI